jgi:hypothetical protein
MPMADTPSEPFYLIVADHDRRVFAVEGPMTDDQPWHAAARHALDVHRRHIVCGPTGPDRAALVADYQRTYKLAGVPPGSILRPRG